MALVATPLVGFELLPAAGAAAAPPLFFSLSNRPMLLCCGVATELSAAAAVVADLGAAVAVPTAGLVGLLELTDRWCDVFVLAAVLVVPHLLLEKNCMHTPKLAVMERWLLFVLPTPRQDCCCCLWRGLMVMLLGCETSMMSPGQKTTGFLLGGHTISWTISQR